jgi:hypothetical protein
MTTHKRTTLPNLAAKPNSTPDVFDALSMFYEALNDCDVFRVQAAFRHLEFLQDMQMLSGLNRDCGAILTGYERGEGRRS